MKTLKHEVGRLLFNLGKRMPLSSSEFLLIFRIFSEFVRFIFLNCSPASGTLLGKADQLNAFPEVRLGLLKMFLNSQQVSLEQIRDSQMKAVKELCIKLKLDSVTFKLK